MLNATLVKRIDITPELTIFRVKPDIAFGKFMPGQYVALGLPGSAPRPATFPQEPEEHAPDKIIKRAYSIGSSPTEGEYIELYIAIVPTGALTSRLALLQEGDRLFAATKIIGTFTLSEVPADHNLVLVSTGTGIAPFMSMLRTSDTWSQNRKITIVHGVRKTSDLAYREELLDLQSRNSNFKYYAYVSREEGNAEIRKGYVQQLLEGSEVSLNPLRDHVYVCGNPAMIDDVEKILVAKEYTVHSKRNPHGALHVEKYW